MGYEQSEAGETEVRSKIDEDCDRVVSQYGPRKIESNVISQLQTPKKLHSSQGGMIEDIVNL
jgi:hypothetical protein